MGGRGVERAPFFLVTIICRYQINGGRRGAWGGGAGEWSGPSGFANAPINAGRNKILLPNNIRGRSLLLLNSAALLRNDPR